MQNTFGVKKAQPSKVECKGIVDNKSWYQSVAKA